MDTYSTSPNDGSRKVHQYKHYHLTPDPQYKGSQGDFTQSNFSLFRASEVYRFPIFSTQKFSPSNSLLIKCEKIVQASKTDIEDSIRRLHQESPFKTDEQTPKAFHMFEEDSSEVYSLSMSEEQALERPNRSFLKTRLSRPITNSSAFNADSEKIQSKQEFTERFSTQADNASIISEGGIQSVPSFPEGLSTKNPLNISPLIDVSLIRLSQKVLQSIIPSIEESYSSHHWESFYSPITVKVVVLDGEGPDLIVINALPSTGFHSAPTIDYSEVEDKNRASLPRSKDKVYINLLTQSILECIGRTPVAFLSFGFEHALLVTNTGKIMTWGYGGSGCLGHGSVNSQAYPLLIETLLHENCVFAESGGYHSLAITSEGCVYTWGRGDVHQIGLSAEFLQKDAIGFYSASPQKLVHFEDIKIVSGACGEAHTLLLDADGKVYSFGWGEDGQLGISRHLLSKAMISTEPNVLQALLALTVIKVKAGNLFSACLTNQGEVYVWGCGEQGQLGQGKAFTQSDYPIQISEMQGVLDIQCGESHMVCIDNRGTLWGWGLGKAVDMMSCEFADGSDVVCFSPKILSELENATHFRIDAPRSPSMILPNIDYQERISELAEQLRVLYAENQQLYQLIKLNDQVMFSNNQVIHQSMFNK